MATRETVIEVCDRHGCGEEVTPDEASQCVACKQHFCDQHLRTPPASVDGFLCDPCLANHMDRGA